MIRFRPCVWLVQGSEPVILACVSGFGRPIALLGVPVFSCLFRVVEYPIHSEDRTFGGRAHVNASVPLKNLESVLNNIY